MVFDFLKTAAFAVKEGGKTLGSLAMAPMKILSATSKVARFGFNLARDLTTGPIGSGLLGFSPGLSARKLIVPGLLLGGYGTLLAGRSLLGAPKDMHSPRAAWGYTQGDTRPYNDHPMEFSSVPRNIDMGATGSLNFALHNRRKR